MPITSSITLTKEETHSLLYSLSRLESGGEISTQYLNPTNEVFFETRRQSMRKRLIARMILFSNSNVDYPKRSMKFKLCEYLILKYALSDKIMIEHLDYEELFLKIDKKLINNLF